MKKTYTKPALYMEDFTLSQSIAHNCGDGLDWSQANLKYKSTCGWNTGLDVDGNGVNEIVFTASAGSNCNKVLGEGEKFMGICYNNPDGGLNVFNS